MLKSPKPLIDSVNAHGGGGMRAEYGWTDVSRFAAMLRTYLSKP
ncbi:hypothetical protein [Nocardia sp. XZ_19_231]|nr:hypothetical protein [Nocardia sp. XZ_19_231]